MNIQIRNTVSLFSQLERELKKRTKYRSKISALYDELNGSITEEFPEKLAAHCQALLNKAESYLYE